jgi:diguanylate cyclase (GGDEF)-like protein
LSPVLFVLSAIISLFFIRSVWSRRHLPGFRFYTWLAGTLSFWCLLEVWESLFPAYSPLELFSNLKLSFIGALPVLGLAGLLDQRGQLLRLDRWQLGGMVGVPAVGMAMSWFGPDGSTAERGLASYISAWLPRVPPAAFSLVAMFALPMGIFAAAWFVRLYWRRVPSPRRWLMAAAIALPFLIVPVVLLLDGGLVLEIAPGLLSICLFALASVFSGGTSPLSYGIFGREESLINRLALAVLVIDPSGRILDINETAAHWAGMARQGLVGRPIFDYSRQIGRILLESHRGVTLDQDIDLDTFSPPRTCHMHLSEEPWKGDQVLRVITLEDHSRFIKEYENLRRDRGLLEAALEGHQSGLMVTDPNGRVVLRTASLLQTFSLPEHAFNTGLLGWRNQMAQVMKDPTRFHRFLDQTIQQPAGETLEMLEMSSGRWLECRSHTNVLPSSGMVYRIWSFTDYTEQARREQELEHLSTHDSLTGVNNRAYFETEMRRLRLGRRYPVSLIVLDVDGLKTINDRHGHPVGDEILRQTAQVLQRACRSDDVVARIGGDEFCVLLMHSDSQVAEHVIDRINSLQNLYNIRQPGPPLSLSLGYAVSNNPAELDTLFQRADSIMYAARYKKRSGGARSLI